MIDGKRLYNLRKEHDYSRREVAEEIEVTERQIVRYEAEEGDITSEILTRLARFFNVSTDYLLGLTDNPAPNVEHDFSPEEVAIISARRRGDYREAMKLMAMDELKKA